MKAGMNMDKINYVYMLGIGGIGMSALARFFKAMGKTVAGYDKTLTPLTHALEEEQIDVHDEDAVSRLPAWLSMPELKEQVLVIFTPAIPAGHREMNYLKEQGFSLYKRSQVLGLLTKNSFTVAVAGTHGKTTTTSIIAHVLKSSGFDCTAFLGGISVNYNSNLILSQTADLRETTIVVEADEFDRSFLTLYPDIAVITSMDADHLDIYGDQEHLMESYRLFAGQVKDNGVLIYKAGLQPVVQSGRQLTYSISSTADIEGKAIRVENHRYYFDVTMQGKTIRNCTLGIPGRHNVENAVAAIAVAWQLGIGEEKIQQALMSYAGVKRRFEFHIREEDCTYIDDYAHHPEELRAAISSVRELFPGKRLTGIFQPHLFSRTRDFAGEFARSLSLLDELILLDIYPAREMPIPGITSSVIFDRVTIPSKTLCRKEELMNVLAGHTPEILLTLGAGDIDQFVYPIRDLLKLKKSLPAR